jgi:hypothetical protein
LAPTVVNGSDGELVMRSPNGAVITLSKPDASGRRKAVLRSPSGGVVTYADARSVPGLATVVAVRTSAAQSASAHAVAREVLKMPPGYADAIRRAAPGLRVDEDDLVELHILGVSPAYLKSLVGSGYPALTVDEVVEARAIGIDAAYVRNILHHYGRLPMEQLVELKAAGVTARDIERARQATGRLPSVDALVEMRILGRLPTHAENGDTH